jgi:hypothetical protein
VRPFTIKSGTGKTHTVGSALAACQRRLSVGLSTAATVVHEPMTVDGAHPDTGRLVSGTPIPEWEGLTALVREPAFVPPGIAPSPGTSP